MIHLMHKMALHLPPELAHNLGIWSLGQDFVQKRLIASLSGMQWEKQPVELAGLKFSNPIGLAAGLDKNAQVLNAFSYLGFSFLELGTVTPKPQSGNPKPRLFRLSEKQSLLNRMGFNNLGKEVFLRNLLSANPKAGVKIGVNIGKNKSRPNEEALEDYKELLSSFRGHCDYITVNVSSPNTQGLRDLQNLEFLSKVSDLLEPQDRVFLKLAPDMPEKDFHQVLEATKDWNFKALILTNTLNVKAHAAIEAKYGSGGLSGELLRIASREALFKASKICKLPLISVGGVDSADEVRWRLDHGASLVQIYTALVYQGPLLVKQILDRL
tara:strand:+ start:6718 stop:7695 length:978 start_codon:yes stop_codon:yes gene_type:complete